jgi:hypothetical protein
MADTATPSTQGTSSMAVDIQEVLASELASDLRIDGRSHSRYLETLDRVYLDQYVAGQDPVPRNVADNQNASHVPVPVYTPVTKTP